MNQAVSTNVDTADNITSYRSGLSKVYELNQVRSAKHVGLAAKRFKFDFETSRQSQLKPLKWDRLAAEAAGEEFYKRWEPADITNDELRQHVSLCLDRARFFSENYNPIKPSPEFLTYRSLVGGHKFNNQYASDWKDARFVWANTERVNPIDIDLLSVDFTSYNNTFPPWFLIFWGEEPFDYLWQLGDKPKVDQEVLQSISDIVAGYSEKYNPTGDFSVPDWVTWSPSSSNAFDGYRETAPEWELEYEFPEGDWIDNRLCFLRGFALKRPTESRDIGTLTPQSLRAHRNAMYPLQQACKKIPGCVYGGTAEDIKATVTRLGESCRYFYMRDYTKSGMTIPHEVIEAVLRGFYRRDAKKADWAVKLFLNSVVFLKDGDEWSSYHPVTGLPLGMFVEGYTLLQYAMNDYITEQIGCRLMFNGTNDDMIVGDLSKSKVEFWQVADLALQEDLGMSVKGSKTGISTDRFIYCEEYWDGENILPKDVLWSLALLGAKYAINVVHAKELVNSLLLSCDCLTPNVKKAVHEVVGSYHYEFSPQEIDWPYLFGGWWPTYRDGLDSSIEWRNGDCIADAAYWATRVRTKVSKQLKDSATLAFGRKRNLTLLESPDSMDDLIALQPLFGSKKCLKDYYQLISRAPREIKRKYAQLYRLRQETFRGYMTGIKDMPSVLDGWLKRHPKSVIVKGLPGVRYTKDVFMVTKPRIILKLDDADARLIALAAKGLISVSLPCFVTPSQRRLHDLGITKELKCDRYPMPSQGMPLSFLQGGLSGIFDFYNRTKMTVVSAYDGDMPFDLTRHWKYIPLPVAWLQRCENAYRKGRGVPELNESTAAWWYRAVCGVQLSSEEILNWDIPEQPEVPEELSVDDGFETMLRTLLDSVSIQEMRAKIVPLGPFGSDVTNTMRVRVGDNLHTYVETSAGSWLPTTAEEMQPDFWSKSESEDEVATYLWD